jgi:hypothetical protein
MAVVGGVGTLEAEACAPRVGCAAVDTLISKRQVFDRVHAIKFKREVAYNGSV